jgi:phage gpG-like protein
MSVLVDMAARIESPEYLSGLAARATSLVQKNIKEGAWAANAPLTIANKKGSKPLLDSNELLTSLASRVEGQSVICGTVKRYAQTVHDGGTIKPQNTKFLTIPASWSVRRKMLGSSPRGYIESLKKAGYAVFFRVRKGGDSGVVMMQPKKKGAEPVVIFILKKSITLPARPFMRLPEEYLAQLRAYTANYLARRN